MPGADSELEEIRQILRRSAELHAAAEARMDRADARADRADARMDRADARAAEMDARFDRRMKGFEKLVKIGMRELADMRRLGRQLDARLERYAKDTDQKIDALIDAQQRTETSLRAFLDSRRGRNGHNGKSKQ